MASATPQRNPATLCHSAVDYEDLSRAGGWPEEYNCYCPIGEDHDIQDGWREEPSNG